LEEIYRSLRLGEEAEGAGRGEPRPQDDMAFRRMRGSSSSVPNSTDTRRILGRAGSFLLVSPALSPPPPPPPPPLLGPDVTYDDVVFRSLRHKNNTLKVADPQPPFGIPLGPVSPAPDTDYLHALPLDYVVTDDLAFRTLRKDAPVKRKAVRSNTADLAEVRNTARRLSSAEGLRLADRMLEARRRESEDRRELRRRFFGHYTSLEEDRLLRQLEEEHHAPPASNTTTTSQSEDVARLLTQLTNSLEYDFSVSAKSPPPPSPPPTAVVEYVLPQDGPSFAEPTRCPPDDSNTTEEDPGSLILYLALCLAYQSTSYSLSTEPLSFLALFIAFLILFFFVLLSP
jgi:hypothetical protein